MTEAEAISQLTKLDEFEKVGDWLIANLPLVNGVTVEEVCWNVGWYKELGDMIKRHVPEYLKSPKSISNPLRSMWIAPGFYGDMYVRLLTRKRCRAVKIPPLLFDPLPIHEIDRVCDLRLPSRYDSRHRDNSIALVDEALCYRVTVFMFGDDFPDLSDSFRVMKLMRA